MTIETIKLIVPLDPLVLKATANVLLKLSGDNSISDADITGSVFKDKPAAATPPPAAEVDNTDDTAPPAPPANAPATNETSAPDNAGTEAGTPADVTVVVPGEKAGNEPGVVYVDADGVPWDERIHAGSKATLKRGGTWKLARGMSDNPDLVASVTAELKAAMSAPTATAPDNVVDINKAATPPPPGPTAPPPEPEAETAPPPPAAVETVTKYITPDGGEFTREELLAANWTDEQINARESVEIPVESTTAPGNDAITFPVLMSKITAGLADESIDDAMVSAAVNMRGLESLPLLSARPDLIPAVYADLFGAA